MFRILIFATIAFAISAPAHAALSSQQIRFIQSQLAPAYIDGDSLTIANLATQVFRDVKSRDRNQVDALLRREGSLPLADLSRTSRMELIRSGFRGQVAEPTEEEIGPLLDAFSKEIDSELNKVKSLVNAKLDDNLVALEDHLWNLHVSRNQLSGVLQFTSRGVAMAQFNRDKLRDEIAEARDIARSKFEKQATVGQALQEKVDDTTILVRLKRIEIAEKILQDSKDVEQRLMAAWVGDSDAPLVKEYFQNVAEGKITPPNELATPGIAAAAERNVEDLRTLAGPELLEKSRHFFVGLHWWLRGRYGAGPHGFGMIKDRTAMVSGQRLFALYMPTIMPTPTSPYDSDESIPTIDRRHHYIWMFEYRRLIRTTRRRTQTSSTSTNKITEKVKLPQFF